MTIQQRPQIEEGGGGGQKRKTEDINSESFFYTYNFLHLFLALNELSNDAWSKSLKLSTREIVSTTTTTWGFGHSENVQQLIYLWLYPKATVGKKGRVMQIYYFNIILLMMFIIKTVINSKDNTKWWQKLITASTYTLLNNEAYMLM